MALSTAASVQEVTVRTGAVGLVAVTLSTTEPCGVSKLDQALDQRSLAVREKTGSSALEAACRAS